jgi:hypothetical protein
VIIQAGAGVGLAAVGAVELVEHAMDNSYEQGVEDGVAAQQAQDNEANTAGYNSDGGVDNFDGDFGDF